MTVVQLIVGLNQLFWFGFNRLNGIENYSRYLTGRVAGAPPPTLFEYIPDHAIIFADESPRTFSRWRANSIMHFDFSRAVEAVIDCPDVSLTKPDEYSREILMQRVEQLPSEEKSILATSITPEFRQVVTKIFGPAVNDFLEILTVDMPNQESEPSPMEPMVAQGEGMMMNRPPVEETAPAQV